MVMLPPWSNPDPVLVTSPKKAAKKPAKKAQPEPAASVPTPAAPVKKRAPKKATPDGDTAATAAPPPAPPAEPTPAAPPRRQRELGPVEAATRAELEAAGVLHSALAASALAMARNVDEADTAAGASSAARELRIVLPLARTTVNPLSPPVEPEKSQDDSGTVVGPTRLDALRKRAAKRASS